MMTCAAITGLRVNRLYNFCRTILNHRGNNILIVRFAYYREVRSLKRRFSLTNQDIIVCEPTLNWLGALYSFLLVNVQQCAVNIMI